MYVYEIIFVYVQIFCMKFRSWSCKGLWWYFSEHWRDKVREYVQLQYLSDARYMYNEHLTSTNAKHEYTFRWYMVASVCLQPHKVYWVWCLTWSALIVEPSSAEHINAFSWMCKPANAFVAHIHYTLHLNCTTFWWIPCYGGNMEYKRKWDAFSAQNYSHLNASLDYM